VLKIFATYKIRMEDKDTYTISNLCKLCSPIVAVALYKNFTPLHHYKVHLYEMLARCLQNTRCVHYNNRQNLLSKMLFLIGHVFNNDQRQQQDKSIDTHNTTKSLTHVHLQQALHNNYSTHVVLVSKRLSILRATKVSTQHIHT